MSSRELPQALQNVYKLEDETTVIQIPFERIMEVTAKSLLYKCNNDEIRTIYLDDCVKNVNVALNQDFGNRSDQITQVVGGRYFSHTVAFYEFFTDGHHTRFYMTLRQTPFKKLVMKMGLNMDTKAFTKFYSLQKKLTSFGYTTIDLT